MEEAKAIQIFVNLTLKSLYNEDKESQVLGEDICNEHKQYKTSVRGYT